MTQIEKYQRCMVMAGGGFRFGIYLGMYAAACEAGRKPDLLLASCGGAMAAAIIHGLPEDAQRKAWLMSKQMYEFCCQIKPSYRSAIVPVFAQALKRKISKQAAPLIPDLFNDYLFEIPLPLPLPPPPSETVQPALALICSKLLFSEKEVLQARGKRKLFAETVRCEARGAALLQEMPSPFVHPRWGEHALSADLLTDVQMPLHEAVRISLADFFYFQCHHYGADYYSGGVLDLFPIEVAKQLAHEIIIEFKQSFDQKFATAAWRSVLGLDANQRLRYVHGQFADVWVDTSDIEEALKNQQVQKKIDWRNNCISLRPPDSYEAHVCHMNQQWEYGYQRAMQAFERPPNHKSQMRNINRYNRPEA